MTDQHMLIIIILCGIVTILVRVIPFMMISRVNLPDVLIRWLSFIPITLFTALVLDGLIQQHEGSVGYTLNVPFIIALIPTILLAIYTRSLTWTIFRWYCIYRSVEILSIEIKVYILNFVMELVKIQVVRKFR